jgi:hypothetical protein
MQGIIPNLDTREHHSEPESRPILLGDSLPAVRP